VGSVNEVTYFMKSLLTAVGVIVMAGGTNLVVHAAIATYVSGSS
jgi:hypothetical protein